MNGVPWKLHDVGQRLLLADKKTEEDRTKGCLGAAPGEPGRIDDGTVRGYFDELLRVRGKSSAPSRCTTLATSFARRIMTEERERFSKESCYHRTFSLSTFTCVAKLI